ncbi:MAG: hypothetical protein JSR64_17040 [Nitrospira sp.]|nr:hypothetical protein [Nitrospira sp.]
MADDDRYFVDEKPEVRHGPPATGSTEHKSVGGMFKQQAGPLPVWGWLAVAVVGVFLWRRISGSGGSSSAVVSGAGSTSPAVYPSMGGVFLLPGSGGGVGGASGSAQPDSAVNALAQALWDNSTLSAGNQDMSLVPPTPSYQYNPQSESSDNAGFYQTLASQPTQTDRVALGQFYADNAAKSQLGLPYFTGQFVNGNPAVYNPSTGVTNYVNMQTGGVLQ